MAALAGDERLVPMAINTSAVTSHPAILRPVRVSVAGPAGACVAPATSAAGAAPAPSPPSGLFADVVALHRDVQLAAVPIDITDVVVRTRFGKIERVWTQHRRRARENHRQQQSGHQTVPPGGRARGPSTARETFSWAPPRAHTESSRRNALPVECTSLVIRPTMHGRTSLFSPPTMWSTRQHSLDGSATCASSVSEPTWPARAASSPIKRRWMSSAPWSTRSPPPHRQAILAIGRQDVDPDGLAPSAAAQLTPATSAQPAGAHTSSSMPSTSRKKSDHSPPSCWISPISASAARRRSLTNSSVATSATAIPK